MWGKRSAWFCAWARNRDDQGKLAAAVPETFRDAIDLLLFAIRVIRECGGLSSDDMELTIFSNVDDALSTIRNSFTKAVRDASYDRLLGLMDVTVQAAKKDQPPYDVLRDVKV
jgi:hypothetical protein